MPQGPRFEKLVAEAKARIREVAATQAAEWRRRGAILIDVREPDEFAKEHVPNAVPLSKGIVELKIEKHVSDPDALLVCYCGGGSRSALAADNLQKMGYTNVYSLTGGFKAWKDAGLPTES